MLLKSFAGVPWDTGLVSKFVKVSVGNGMPKVPGMAGGSKKQLDAVAEVTGDEIVNDDGVEKEGGEEKGAEVDVDKEGEAFPELDTVFATQVPLTSLPPMGEIPSVEMLDVNERRQKQGNVRELSEQGSPGAKRLREEWSKAAEKEDNELKRKAEDQPSSSSWEGQKMQIGKVDDLNMFVVDEEEAPIAELKDIQESYDESHPSWELIQKGRWKEIEQMGRFGVYTLRPTAELYDYVWFDSRWVDELRNGEWRCRFVGKDFAWNSPERDGLYTPASSDRDFRIVDAVAVKKDYPRIVGDACNAYFHAVEKGKVCTRPPAEILNYLKEQGLSTEVMMVLHRKLCGKRDASAEFGDHFANVLQVEAKLDRHAAFPSMHHRDETDLTGQVHQDDIHATAAAEYLIEFMTVVGKHIDMKWSRICGPGDAYEFLKAKRVVVENGIFIFPHQKYIYDILKSLNMLNCKPATTPIVSLPTAEEKEFPLNVQEAGLFRHCVGVLRFLRRYVLVLNFVARVLSQGLSLPTQGDLKRLKRCARFLQYIKDDFALFMPKDGSVEYLEAFSDSDHGGDKVSRKSTSSEIIMFGGCCLSDAARQHQVVADSSGVAEFYAMVGVAANALMLAHLLRFVGFEVKVRLRVDSSAAKAIAQRQGLGKLKFFELKTLWLQDAVKRNLLKIQKEDTATNVADIGTKPLAETEFWKFAEMANYVRVEKEVSGTVASRAKKKEDTVQGLRFLDEKVLAAVVAAVEIVGAKASPGEM